MHMNRIVLAGSTALSRPRIIRAATRDAMMTFDRQTIDSAGAFLVGELERLDQELHAPLYSVTWSRDVDLREDVSIADEVSSFTNSTFGGTGGINATGKAWVGKDTNVIPGIALDIGKTAQPLYLWAMQLGWTIPELESAQKLGRPVDAQKFEGMQIKHQMDIDEQVYIGDTSLGIFGLVNSDKVTNVADVAAGAATTKTWATKTADEMLADVNEVLTSAWSASGWAVVPDRLLLPPTQFGTLVSTKVSAAGNISVLEFLKINSLANAQNGRPLEILPCKWLTASARGAAKDRMVAYTKARRFVRFPMVPLQRTPLEYRDLRQLTTYFGRLGVMEFVYPETIAYRDAI